MADWKKIGTALQGMGMGFQGRGGEWQYAQDRAREMEYLEQERQRKLQEAAREQYMQAIPGANRVFLDHLNTGRINEAFQWAERGIQDAQALGQDPSVWAQRLEWLGGGMVNKAIEDAAIDEREFVLQGMIEPVGGAGETPATVLARDDLYDIIQNKDKYHPDVYKAAMVEAGLRARQGMSANERIALDPSLSKAVTASQSEIEGGKAAGKQAIDLSKEYLEKVALVDKGIININKGIRALDNGAKSGAIDSMLPSIRTASVELENVRNQMGLDIVGATTFGALSESELAFALDTAMPEKLNEPQLRDWLVRKRDAQAKLRGEFERAAKFLSRPENTLADYYEALETRGMYEKKDNDNDPLRLFD
jgi:hypothetical protein